MAIENNNKSVFKKQVILFLVIARKVKRNCKLISAEKVTFQHEKCCAMHNNAQFRMHADSWESTKVVLEI